MAYMHTPAREPVELRDPKDPLLGLLVKVNELAPNSRLHGEVGRVVKHGTDGGFIVDFGIRGSVEVSAMHFALYVPSTDGVPA